ncbi:MAG: PorT family protein [Flavobacteriales bacterium]|nr:PorT family protein [Flavobacteriales bacterium]
MKYIRYVILFLSVVVLCSEMHAQRRSQSGGVSMKNLPTFDYKKVHFGFLLSMNKSDFQINYRPDFTFQDSLLSIENVPQSGFNLALLASWDIQKNIRLRFIPGLSFQDRGLNYRFLDPEGTTTTLFRRTESVYLDIPLVLKLRTNRIRNFAAYALIGGKYSIDMQSQKDVDNQAEVDKIIKLQKTDYSMDAGAGVDFFLPYFKFGLELKTAIGFKNVLIQEETQYSSPIESLRTRTVIFSILFEG